MLSRAKKQKLDKKAAKNSRKIEQNATGSSRNIDIEKICDKDAAAGSSRYIDIGRNGAAGSSKDIEKISKDAASAFFDPRHIPIEVWNHVFQYVSVYDLKRLSLSCKSFYQTIGFLPDAMDRIVLKIRETMTAKDQAKLLESSRQYRNINIMIINKIGDDIRNIQKFLEAQAEFIRDLNLFNFPVFGFSNAFKLMWNLQILTFAAEKSEIFNADQDFVCPTVKKLIFGLPNDISETSFLSFIKRFPNIKEVRIGMKVGVNLMKLVADNCPNLKKISMRSFDHDDFKDLIFKNLVELIIEYYFEANLFEMDSIKMEQTAKAFENLEILKIKCICIVLNINSLLWILENLKKLTHLEIGNGMQFTEAELCNISGHFKNLKVLTISNTQESMEEFKRRLQQFPALNFSYLERYDVSYGYWDHNSEDGYDEW